MTTIVTRAGKGSALTHNEVDSNFTNLNNAKYESGNNATLGTIQGSTITATTAFSGALNGTVGATTPAAGTFTNLAYTGTLTGGTGVINIGSGQVYKDASGNVGIGTASPSSRLTVGGNPPTSGAISAVGSVGGVALALSDNTNSSLYVRNIAGGSIIGTDSGGNLRFASNGNTASEERMRITSDGNVGIGTSSPTYRLQVQSGSSTILAGADSGATTLTNATQKIMRFGVPHYTNAEEPVCGLFVSNESTVNTVLIGGGTGQFNAATSLQFYTAANNTTTSGSERMRITSGGEVYIAGTTDQGAYNLQVNGTGVWGAGAYVNGSDARIKEDIEPISSSLDVINKLNPVTYKYKENWTKDRSTQTGFIAQELLVALEGQNYVDGIVQQGGEYMSVAYQNIIPILTKAIQELNAKVEALKAQLNKES